MKAPRVEVTVTFYAVFNGFKSLGVFSAYQLAQFEPEELAQLWGYPVV